MKNEDKFVRPERRAEVLARTRNLKMARSSHAYVRGNVKQFYQWLEGQKIGSLPDGPSIWICGDCHVGNLGPVANALGHIEIQIRDLDQTVIGNPAHDLIRLGLSLASAARSSDLPGVTTSQALEQIMEGYKCAFDSDFDPQDDLEEPESIREVIKQSAAASWRTLATERIGDKKPTIPLGRRFWPLAKDERHQIETLFSGEDMRALATLLRSRDDDAQVTLIDAAYWLKGCSSLGRLRYAVLLEIDGNKGKRPDHCLMDLKEAALAAAPHKAKARMPTDQAERVVAGAKSLSPFLGDRMRAVALMGKSIFVRELLPQDLKIELDRVTRREAINVAYYLAAVVGKAHSRQMDGATRKKWQVELLRNRSKSIDAPDWLWSAVVSLLVDHERAYLEHCREHESDGEA